MQCLGMVNASVLIPGKKLFWQTPELIRIRPPKVPPEPKTGKAIVTSLW